MFRDILVQMVDDQSSIMERDKGVAFLFAARSIYNLADIFYFSANIPRRSSGSFVHCAFSGDFASQAITATSIPDQKLTSLGIVKQSQEFAESNQVSSKAERVILPLTIRCGETAVLGFTRDLSRHDDENDTTHSLAELKILGNYFHSHMLRRNGIDTSEALVVSARELDCLRWVAAGKSAWEASVILGISERTVRFHLNSAREKLNCTTTTQAVAKVVAQQLIAV
jgi:DNA-binding CsgD family transcriptional regulator